MTIYWFAALTANTAAAIAIVPSPPTPPPPPVIVTPQPIGLAPRKGVESMPIPKGNPGVWAGSFDYPPLALREEREGTTAFSLTIDKSGRVSECRIAVSSGHADLDQTTCTSVTRRAAFYPAQDKKGEPTTGTYSNRVRWQIPSVATIASMPLQANSYPRSAQIRNPSSLRVAKEDYPPAAMAALQEGMATFTLDIDNGGTVRNCSVTRTSNFPLLDDQSCALARKWAFEPARDIDGKPVAGRTSHNINWRLPKGAVSAAPSTLRPLTNPFEKTGTMTMTLDFDKEGKLFDCAFEHTGAMGFFGTPPNLSSDICRTSFGRRDVQPFVSTSGTPEPRRVTVRMSVEHSDTETAPPAE